MKTNHHAIKKRLFYRPVWGLFLALALGALSPSAMAAAGASHRASSVFYVSKLGDNSDGSSWSRAFHTIQAALQAIPDDKGGYQIRIRPDTYMEANLYPAHKGAAGAYNILAGDFDGRLGSGAVGWVVIDSGDPQKGFKSYDWWGPIRAYRKGWSPAHQGETFSAVVWDRWVLRRLYATGGDGGLFFDLVDKAEPFTVTVEDCVGIGRAFGGGVGNVLSRPNEPSLFQRCKLWCLDWWGDAAGAYVRAENPSMPPHPDVVFEECALVGPDNALQAGNPGYSGFTRVRLKRCQLVTLNFSQPQGKPSSGIIFSTIDGKLLQVDLEDCTLMGYRVFGAGKGNVIYTTKGDVKAYVQYQQDLPPGFLRLGHWPVDVFQCVAPPPPPERRAVLQKDPRDLGDLCEVAPIIWQEQLVLLACVRPATGGKPEDYYLSLKTAETGQELARFATGYGLASAILHRGSVYVFASRYEPASGWNDVTLFRSSDLSSWQKKLVIEQTKEHLFNSSVCAVDDSFVMAYESDDPQFTPFTIKFAKSIDLENWTKIPDTIFGAERYAACPCLRYANGYYYLLYLEHRTPRWFFETYLARSKDLRSWELSTANPLLTPGDSDGINASDPDLIEFRGQTHIYYSVGDQRTWAKIRSAIFPGPMSAFFNRFFTQQTLGGTMDSPQSWAAVTK